MIFNTHCVICSIRNFSIFNNINGFSKTFFSKTLFHLFKKVCLIAYLLQWRYHLETWWFIFSYWLPKNPEASTIDLQSFVPLLDVFLYNSYKCFETFLDSLLLFQSWLLNKSKKKEKRNNRVELLLGWQQKLFSWREHSIIACFIAKIKERDWILVNTKQEALREVTRYKSSLVAAALNFIYKN